MENYHLFIVDRHSLNYHLKYGFVGTGRANTDFSIGLWEDIERLKIGDKIIFYLQNIKMFFGIYEVSSLPFFEIENPPYLQNNEELVIINDGVNISLKYRALIKGYQVYKKGISEFDLIDILPIHTKDVLWSILYRKLKGSRGCSPIFPIEYEIIHEKLRQNNQLILGDKFEISNKEIHPIEGQEYIGSLIRNCDNLDKIITNNYSEHHLHSILLEKLPSNIFGNNIKWVGNEVYSGAGMQAIDLVSINQEEGFSIIEVKKDVIPKSIFYQIRKYVYWIQGRFQVENPNFIQPILIGKISSVRQKKVRKIEFINFNSLNISNPIKYFEYERTLDSLIIKEINMISENFDVVNSFTI